MPQTDQILEGLQAIVNNYSLFSIIWHAVFYVLLIALLAKWKPSNKLLAILLIIPLFSVAIFAWFSANPFNGTLFTIAALLVLVAGFKTSPLPIRTSRRPFLVAGILMVVFGLLYPHFVSATSVLTYLYTSPVGLIPCPTLSALIGLVLIFNGLNSRLIMLYLIILGLFYGLFGTLKLGVYLDVVLVAGSVALLIKYRLNTK